MLVFIEVQIALGLLVFLAEHAVRRRELGHDQAAAPQVADKAAEHGIGDASHGCENRGRGDSDIADEESLWHQLQWLCLADKACPELVEGSVRPTRAFPIRVVPELLHISILLGSSTWPAKRKPPRKARAYLASLSTRITSSPVRALLQRAHSWRTCGGSAPRVQRCPSTSACP